jgi:hypothetical protein
MIDHLIDLTAIADIARQPDHLPAGFPGDFSGRLLQSFRVPRCDHQIHTLPGERERNRFADAATAANDYACSTV